MERCSIESYWNDRSINVKTAAHDDARRRTERRADALSKERIVEAAIEILDAEGEDALTFRALAARLATGSGAIYWHVADKHDLLAAATDHIIARVMTSGERVEAAGRHPHPCARGVRCDRRPSLGGGQTLP